MNQRTFYIPVSYKPAAEEIAKRLDSLIGDYVPGSTSEIVHSIHQFEFYYDGHVLHLIILANTELVDGGLPSELE